MIEAEYKYFFENDNWVMDNEGFSNPLYKLEIYNNSSVSSGFIFNSYQECEFRKIPAKDNCPLDLLDDKMKLRDIISLIHIKSRKLC